MTIVAIVLIVGYALIIGLCRMAARADRVAATWEEPMPVSMRPVQQSPAAIGPVARAG